MIISSKQNETVKEIAKLADKKFRDRTGLYIVESIKLVNECIAAGAEVEKIVCTEELSDKYPTAIIVSESVFSAISTEKTPQGVLAVVKKPQITLKPPAENCILLDRLQDPGNLGAVIRTANAAGYGDIYLINCSDPFSPKSVRASMGGIFYVNVYSVTAEEAFSVLENTEIICGDMDGENVFDFTPPQKFCLCIGNEGSGISEEIFAKATKKVKIPMRETCESLNAAVSAGILMYQLKQSKR